jgi:hypothetical protein
MPGSKLSSYNIIRKKFKFLIEVTLESDGSFVISQKLSNVLNQNGFYENDKIHLYIKNFFSKVSVELVGLNFSFLVPMMFIFPKKKQKTLIYVLNPFSNNFFSLILRLNVLDFYLYLQFKLRNLYFSSALSFYYIKNYLYFYFAKRRKDKFLGKKRGGYLFLCDKKKLPMLTFRRLRGRKRRLRRKRLMKKMVLKKKLNFSFIIKAKK